MSLNDLQPGVVPRPQAAAGVICFRADTVLLVRRGAAPLLGAWSLPGGRIEWGERAQAAALRELAEETGVSATILGLVDVIDGLFGDAATPDHHFLLVDYAARWVSGEPVGGDDAAEAAFHPLADLDRLALWDETARVIRLAWRRFGDPGAGA